MTARLHIAVLAGRACIAFMTAIVRGRQAMRRTLLGHWTTANSHARIRQRLYREGKRD
jgi:hypothetical protein